MTHDVAGPSVASAGSVANETAIDSQTLAVKLHAVAAAACYGDQAIRDWLHIAANHIAFHNMGITGCGRWIPVAERLPEPELDVLAYAITEWEPGWPPQRMVTCHSGTYWYCDSMTVTHWMPLPAPPSDGK